MTGLQRFFAFLFSIVVAGSAAALAANVLFADGVQWIDHVRIALLGISVAWLSWGASLALNGLLAPALRPATSGNVGESTRTAVLVPVYNEDPAKTFSHVAAMVRSLADQGAADRFDFAILSDTNKEEFFATEEHWFSRLRREHGHLSRIFYRRRAVNTGKKAGNITDFIKSSGALYDYLVILDADSLMEGATLVEMVRRMEAEPRLGLLQTLPKIVHARSWFGRAIQFAASYYSPVFARGVAATQGANGPFWGHNAIVRTRAFAQSCGLPELTGRPPFGGHILSHDYVEAALLSRNGWIVRLDTDLEGSFEEGPENVIDYAKRDRRWCQGNLQHSRLLFAPGLRPWSRFTFLQGIMAYLASPIWALFLIASIAAPVIIGEPNYFPEPHRPPVFPRVEQFQALILLAGVAGILVAPKLLIVLQGAFTGRNEGFGGTLRALATTVLEIVWTSVLAPIMLMYQSRSVLQVLCGADGGWPAANREADTVGLKEAWDASWWISVGGIAIFAATLAFAPEILYWLLPVVIPMTLAPLLVHLTSWRLTGRGGRTVLFSCPQDYRASPVIQAQETILARWRRQAAHQPPADLPGDFAAFAPAPTPR
ncbi:glucans biosynthesis glucosyltransferase MdoH [Mesorhizobium xinjiangense]|uniref:glucans biosynthesis glucosyltransferase MdoH n=1 Tax=Mesorhizobium xinjiangense TaxID=2678685 RepID=UPI0012EDC14D|nr:glucans biosynthesis glucosyltransferase MdoH [Mesorhizobium xinjiangense]